jgi:hypothetical protein
MASSIFSSATAHSAGLQRLEFSFPSNLFLPPPPSKNCTSYTEASPVLFLDRTLILIEAPCSLSEHSGDPVLTGLQGIRSP